MAVLSERLLQTSYTREAERAADRFALRMLGDAGIDSSGMAEFFESLHEHEGEMPELIGYFATHPDSAGRARRARENAKAQGAVEPVLSETEWQALKSICD